MAIKTKDISKVKEPIRLRVKKLANGNQSLYLDFYFDGKRGYEFLKLYLVPETSVANREANKETLKLANAIKAKKIVEHQNNAHGFSFGGTKSKASLFEYIEKMAEKKKEIAAGNGHTPDLQVAVISVEKIQRRGLPVQGCGQELLSWIYPVPENSKTLPS